jgi:hypothetical protein
MDQQTNKHGVDSGTISHPKTIPGQTPQQKSDINNDAFVLLMTNDRSAGSKKRRRPEHNNATSNLSTNFASRFVPCPVGCGRNIPSRTINLHLDACLLAQEQQLQKPTKEGLISPPSSSTIMDNNEANSVVSLSQGDTVDHSLAVSSTSLPHGTEDDDWSVSSMTETRCDDNFSTNDSNHENAPSMNNNIFVHMMKKSAQVFSDQASTKDTVQRMHLHENGKVTTTCYSSNFNHGTHGTDLVDQYHHQQQPYRLPLGRIVWSATIQVRKTLEMDFPVKLIVSTSIPPNHANIMNDENRVRLVGNHSRLSVPVLKSILQKSIRRRKPLPSVRVAMELCDKSLGDLLRRLSIILLEDSTLHPDMPLLVWLMMASSKGYSIPLYLMKRVFGIVYEVSSCPWRDPLTTSLVSTPEVGDSPPNVRNLLPPFSITSFQSQFKESLESNPLIQLSDNDIMIWSILIRSNYGGMPGDIRMLHSYAALWKGRLAMRSIPKPTLARLVSSRRSSYNKEVIELEEWSQVPSFVHHKACQQSSSRIDGLIYSTGVSSGMTCGLQRLSFSDFTPEGVDFHCSSVLKDTILCNSSLVQQCLDSLIQIDHVPFGRNLIPNTEDGPLAWLEEMLKSCMWNFSAGVNFRLLSFTVPEEMNFTKRDDLILLKQFWEQHVLPHTRVYCERYIKSRLAV